MANTLDFSSDWGGKIYKDTFTTIRMVTRVWHVGDRTKVCYKKDTWPDNYKINEVEIKPLKDFTDAEIVADLGDVFVMKFETPKAALMDLMKKFYGRKFYWKGEETPAQKITLRKVQTNGTDKSA